MVALSLFGNGESQFILGEFVFILVKQRNTLRRLCAKRERRVGRCGCSRWLVRILVRGRPGPLCKESFLLLLQIGSVQLLRLGAFGIWLLILGFGILSLLRLRLAVCHRGFLVLLLLLIA